VTAAAAAAATTVQMMVSCMTSQKHFFLYLLHAAGCQWLLVWPRHAAWCIVKPQTVDTCFAGCWLLLLVCIPLQGKTMLFMPKLPEAYGVWMGPIQGPDYYKVCCGGGRRAIADA
jgi:hypothetical protein